MSAGSTPLASNPSGCQKLSGYAASPKKSRSTPTLLAPALPALVPPAPEAPPEPDAPLIPDAPLAPDVPEPAAPLVPDAPPEPEIGFVEPPVPALFPEPPSPAPRPAAPLRPSSSGVEVPLHASASRPSTNHFLTSPPYHSVCTYGRDGSIVRRSTPGELRLKVLLRLVPHSAWPTGSAGGSMA